MDGVPGMTDSSQTSHASAGSGGRRHRRGARALERHELHSRSCKAERHNLIRAGSGQVRQDGLIGSVGAVATSAQRGKPRASAYGVFQRAGARRRTGCIKRGRAAFGAGKSVDEGIEQQSGGRAGRQSSNGSEVSWRAGAQSCEQRRGRSTVVQSEWVGWRTSRPRR